LAKAELEEKRGSYTPISASCYGADRSSSNTATWSYKDIATRSYSSIATWTTNRYANARKMAVVIIFSLAPFALSACGGAESVFVLGAGLANFIHTDRVPTDYLAEYASGQECNLLKSIEDGGPLCRNSFNPTVVAPPLYCYRTLGEPSCYVSPDPYKTGAQTIK
jgi:hypothetical protein